MSRRRLLKGAGAAIAGLCLPRRLRAAAASTEGMDANATPTVRYPEVQPGTRLAFPRDHGSHPAYRTEWWYVTGWLRPAEIVGDEWFGFQVTFFRARPPYASENRSAFAPNQLLVAHAALVDRRAGRLVHDQRIARAGFGLAEAGESTTDVRIDDWSLALAGNRYTTLIPAREFSLRLALVAPGAPLLQGEQGYSRKGRHPSQASHYYSRPHLSVSGSVQRAGRSDDVAGSAWLDHEWSSQYMDQEAVGWDWTGINLDGGGALMAFRMRGRSGGVRWAAATLQRDGSVRRFAPEEVAFSALRRWRSPRTGAEYPVAMEVRCGSETWVLEPMIDDQELDARITTGAVYWEGAVQVRQQDRAVGRGYLELTGYVSPMRI